MKIAQRLCECTRRMSGFTLDERSKMWVCGDCGLPRREYYLALRSAQPPGVKIKYAKGFSAPTSQRGRAKPHH